MKTAIAKYNWITNNAYRLDASYHLSDGRQTKFLIEKSPLGTTSLSNLTTDIFMGPRFKRYYVDNKETGVPFMGGSDMQKNDLTNLKLISKTMTKNINQLYLKRNWILVTRSGTIGQTVFTNSDFENKTATEDVIRIIANEEVIKSGFLYAFLVSKYGYNLLTQSTYGAVIRHIEPHHLKELPIPIFKNDIQEKIHNLILKASELRVKANKIFNEVIERIEKPYRISSNKKVKYFSTNIKEIKLGDKFTNENRLEVDYYTPERKNIIELIKQNKWKLLGDISSNINISNLRSRIFVKKGITLITGQSLGLLKPDLSKQISKRYTPKVSENITKDGDILVSAFGTIGKVELAYRNFYSGVFASQQLARIRTKREEIHPGYIYFFLKSKIGQEQMLKFKTGSVIEWLNSHNFASIVVPVPEDKGEEIGSAAYDISLKRQKAYELENQAIQIIENEIASWQKSNTQQEA